MIFTPINKVLKEDLRDRIFSFLMIQPESHINDFLKFSCLSVFSCLIAFLNFLLKEVIPLLILPDLSSSSLITPPFIGQSKLYTRKKKKKNICYFLYHKSKFILNPGQLNHFSRQMGISVGAGDRPFAYLFPPGNVNQCVYV